MADWWFGTLILFFHSVGSFIIFHKPNWLSDFSEGEVYHQPERSLFWRIWIQHFDQDPAATTSAATAPRGISWTAGWWFHHV
jgi:hypothetical protein